MSIRAVRKHSKSQATIEGAGVHLNRAFGFGDPSEVDPFLLLDDFRNDRPEDYMKGFPWHPHRGIETITYVLAGSVEHGDSIGNHGLITPGDVQSPKGRRSALDDGWAWDLPSGDATTRYEWANARLSIVGQFAICAQDDRAALSGDQIRRYS